LYNLAREEGAAARGGGSGRFFLTLCPVASPVSVPEPKSPALQRFRFFFTREIEAGQPHYWLQFGYFTSEHEARKWRDVLARVYPAAVIRKLADGAPAPDILSDSQVLKVLTASPPGARQGKPYQPPAAKTSNRKASTLEDTLNELRDRPFQGFDPDDTLSSTGVRHLHVKFETRARDRKAAKARRKP
jgi:hypothetical protein